MLCGGRCGVEYTHLKLWFADRVVFVVDVIILKQVKE